VYFVHEKSQNGPKNNDAMGGKNGNMAYFIGLMMLVTVICVTKLYQILRDFALSSCTMASL
jgi:hypothetical protein